MTIQALRAFVDKSYPVAMGLSALTAALDATVTGVPLDPALAARIQELLDALGAQGVLDGVSAREAAPLLSEVRHLLLADAKLLYAPTRATAWSYADDQLLQEAGAFARFHAHALTNNVVPGLPGLTERLRAPGASFLDIGVGVGGLALEMARLWPSLRVVGIDVFPPALRLARENVAEAGLAQRIELREQSGDQLDDEAAFDLVWVPMLFIAERSIPALGERALRALRPGAWSVFAFANLELPDPPLAAAWRLRATTFGGPLWAPARVEKLLREVGFTAVRTLPAPPGNPVALVVGQRVQG